MGPPLASHRWMLVIPACLFTFSGCAPPNRSVDPATRQWQDVGRCCRGEVLLIENPTSETPRPDMAPSSVPSATLERARSFTVAVRARKHESTPTRSIGLTAYHNSTGRERGRSVRGTGVVIDRAGLILTNEHVVGDARRIEIHVANAGWIPAHIVGKDPQRDLAVLRVARSFAGACELSDAHDVRVGQPVAALGYGPDTRAASGPMALSGAVSGVRRSLQGALDPTQRRFYSGMLQSTVPIPEGFSGGPLFDARGRVVGVNTAAAVDDATGRRYGYAIPLNTHVRTAINQLRQGRTCRHGFLGLLVCASDSATNTPTGGVTVARVVPNSPAARAGIRTGDVITHFRDRPVLDASALADVVRGAPIGPPVHIQLTRGNHRLVVVARLAEKPRS